MKQDFLKLLAKIAIITVIICLILAFFGGIGSLKVTDGCLLRYNFSSDGKYVSGDQVTNTITLKANANYTTLNTSTVSGTVKLELDPTRYGEWLNTNLTITEEQEIKFTIKGEVSLCKAYLPLNNIQSISNLDKNGNKIAIPRIDEAVEPLSLIFDAKTDEWRNIAELDRNDKVIISISSEKKEVLDDEGNIKTDVQNVTLKDIFTDDLITADCRQGKTQYSPICGRYSIYSGIYPSGCYWNNSCYDCNCTKKCYVVNTYTELGYFFGLCAGTEREVCERCGCWSNTNSPAPEPYRNDGMFTFLWSDNINDLFINTNLQCSDPITHAPKDKDYIMGEFLNKRYFWFSADSATGLLYRLDNSEIPTNIKQRGTDYSFAAIATDQSAYSDNPNFRIIYNNVYASGDKKYLQFRFHDNENEFADNTGGYVLNVKQTKCRRTNGAAITDNVVDRGKVEYIFVPLSENPNDTTSGKTYLPTTISVDSEGVSKITISPQNPGNIWMKIYNSDADYKDSKGQYTVQFFTAQKVGSFTLLILTPLFESLKSRIKEASITIFKNMTCFQMNPLESSNCTNFFNYIRAILTLYIMLYGLMFLLGMVEITQLDLIMRAVKIALVSGLMNERTFEFFNDYVFDFVTGFSDNVISNMAGYSMFSSSGNITNPFMFMDALLSKILFSKTFLGQLLALLAMGISGILYFIIVFIALIIVIITALRAIAIYLMAFMAIAVLIGIAPLFLTFMLFDFTFHLFDNWVKFTFKYMIEPVVLMAGIIILTQLFTIYLDFAVGYSVCWKCALPVKIPFPSIPGLDFAFTNVELFCLNWFAPWGFDHRSGMMGINMQHIIALLMIAYCMYGYTDLSGKLVMKLTGGIGAPSATQMGQSMAGKGEQATLKAAGVDKESRNKISGGFKGRMKQRFGEAFAKKNKSGSGAHDKKKDSNDAPKP